MAKVDLKITVKNDQEKLVKDYDLPLPFMLDPSTGMLRSIIEETVSLFGREVDTIGVTCKIIGL